MGGGTDINSLLSKLDIDSGFSVTTSDMNILFEWKNSSNATIQLAFYYDISSNTRVTMSKNGVRQWAITS